ncbi:hypothetical protein [Cryptosporangium aurantiacum]|uniref:hypothetical protein n=1 Tax=Cryptosporangium aurantiacum TaxID=134849 RepID=UPI0015B82AB9|nr:hypothetical protein [Cryptosporangium aurantiacum]
MSARRTEERVFRGLAATLLGAAQPHLVTSLAFCLVVDLASIAVLAGAWAISR